MLELILDAIFFSLPNWLQVTILTVLALLLGGLLYYFWSQGRLVW